jgi:hypothetical protein
MVSPWRCSHSRASRSPKLACAAAPTGAVPGARRSLPGSAQSETSSAAPGIRHARCGVPRQAATPRGPFSRSTGLPSHSALVAPPLRLAALRWREVLLWKVPPAGSPGRAWRSQSSLKMKRRAGDRNATGEMTGSASRGPRPPRVVGALLHVLRGAPLSSPPARRSVPGLGLRICRPFSSPGHAPWTTSVSDSASGGGSDRSWARVAPIYPRRGSSTHKPGRDDEGGGSSQSRAHQRVVAFGLGWPPLSPFEFSLAAEIRFGASSPELDF